MTDVDSSGRVSAGEIARRLKESGGLGELFDAVDAGGVELTGKDGLVPALVEETLEHGLQAETASHVGCAPGDRQAKDTTNSGNGSYAKTVSSEVGGIVIAVPQDREGSFTPRLAVKGSRRLGGLDEMIVSLYAGPMTIRDVQHHLAAAIGAELSGETIANIADAVSEAVLAWQTRPLDGA